MYHKKLYNGEEMKILGFDDMNDQEWEKLFAAVREVQEWFPEGVVFIGGIAVYAHLLDNEELQKYAAESHDADFMISGVANSTPYR